MRRLAIVLALTGAAALAAAPSALASFHLTRVNEVLTSNGSSTAQQFVELTDPGEPYPTDDGPYWLVVYDANATVLGSQELSNATLHDDAPQGPMLISTSAYDTAAGTTGDFALTVALPTAAGQACFAHDDSKDPVQCMTWGTIATPVPGALSTATNGPAPGDGQSLQAQCDGTGAVAAPTPGAANTEVVPACTNRPPVASFTFSPAAPVGAQAVTFDGSASSDPDAGDHVASWQWTFDGVPVTTTTPTVTRTLGVGAHAVGLTVLDTFGAQSVPVSRSVVVSAGVPTPSDGGGMAPPHTFAGVSLAHTKVRASSTGMASFSVRCPSATTGACAGALTLRDGKKRIVRKSFSIAPGKSGKVKLKLSAAERRKLRKHHTLKLTIAISAHDGTGTAAKAKTVKVTVRS